MNNQSNLKSTFTILSLLLAAASLFPHLLSLFVSGFGGFIKLLFPDGKGSVLNVYRNYWKSSGTGSLIIIVTALSVIAISFAASAIIRKEKSGSKGFALVVSIFALAINIVVMFFVR